MRKQLKAKRKIKGQIFARCYDQTTLDSFQKFWNKVVLFFKLPKKYYFLGRLKWADYNENVICTAGINTWTKRLTNTLTYTGVITRQALGDGVGTPAEADTALFNEVYRNATASATDDENIAYVTAYYTETEVDGTFTEFGNFIDGNDTPDNGQLWTHVNVNWTKANTEVLVVDCKYTFLNA